MNKLIITLTMLTTLFVYAEDGGNCSNSEIDQIYTAKWQEKEMCIDPFATICRFNNDSEKYEERSKKILDQIKELAMRSVYEKYKLTLNKRGITGINNNNFDKITSSSVQACIDDNNCSHQIDFTDSMTNNEIDIVFEALVKLEYIKEINNLMDKKLDMANEAFQLIKQKMVQIVNRELSGKLSKKDLKKQIEMLQDTIGLFSSSKKSLDLNFPNLTDEQKKEIGKDFEKTCFNKLDHIHNQFFSFFNFNGIEYNIVITCPAETLASLEGSETLQSIFNTLAFGLAHELGHEISMDAVDEQMFDQFNECLKETITNPEISAPAENYEDEAQADFWAKRLIGDLLREMKDTSIEDRIHFLKETFIGICESIDDQEHHEARTRLNKSLRLTPEFRDAFNCSGVSNLMRIREPIDCGLDGKKYIMVPEL